MRVEYINPFVETSFRVLQEVLGGAEVKRGDLYLKSTAMPVMGVAALVGLAGDVEGRVLFDMTFETALNIASKMNGEQLAAAGIPAGLVRMSCGLEAKEDLIADLAQALAGIE